MSASDSAKLRTLLSLLDERYGMLTWWPGTPEEIIIGAVLTQQTRWKNVERGINELHHQGLCRLSALASSPLCRIEEAVQCTGFFRMKARRLQNLSRVIMDRFGGVEGMVDRSLSDLRTILLSIDGVGEETADSILCFALGRCSFIIDRYTERICACAGIGSKGGALKDLVESVVPHDLATYRQAHSHFVEYAKEWCGKKRCEECAIVRLRG